VDLLVCVVSEIAVPPQRTQQSSANRKYRSLVGYCKLCSLSLTTAIGGTQRYQGRASGARLSKPADPVHAQTRERIADTIFFSVS
jgi:hypothetical protein